jgi:hypothetical protein
MRREPILAAESAANDEERARLGLFPGEMVYRVDRIRGHSSGVLKAQQLLRKEPWPSPTEHGAPTACRLQQGDDIHKN